MNSYLFLFTLSPVQSFISQARKTQDLYAGSKLLSDLIEKAMNGLPEDTEFIIPSKNLASKPNRFLAIVKKENDGEVKELGNKLESKVKDDFTKIANDIFEEKAKSNKPLNFDEQIKNHLQIHWIALPYDEKNYKSQFKEIESTLGAIKNVREFNQLEETGRKCSLCGERNVLFYGGRKSQIDAIKLKELKQNEGLCAICFTKRFYEKSSFPSTAEIALMDSINKVDKKLIENYMKLFSDFDYQLYYEENLNEKYFEKQNIKNVDISKAKKLLNGINRFAKDNNLKLSKYYAVIMFDGDSMGKWLSGENSKDFHTKLSESLGEFAGSTKNILNGVKGKIVYAGGEDFLGFINLNHLFEVLKELRELFDKKVNQEIHEYKSDNKNLTFSAGIVIAHYKIPLSEVLKWTRQTEKDAKNIDDDKNAFDIAVLKHSGEILKARFKWGYNNNLTENLEILNELTQKLKDDKYSNTFIKNLGSEFSRLMDQKGKTKNSNLISAEIRRLVKNSSQIKKKELKEKDIEKFSDDLIELNRRSESILNFLSSLNIAEFISRYLNKEAVNDNKN